MKVELVTKSIGVGKYADLDPDQIIAAVARHGTIKDDGGKLIRYLIDHAHWSPLEHVHYTFLIECSRGIATQILRHKSGHFQQSSTRYEQHPEMEEIEFRLRHESNRQSSTTPVGRLCSIEGITEHILMPDGTAATDSAVIKAEHAIKKIQEAYRQLIEAGIAYETARDILPIATRTRLHFTANLRDFLAFLNVRCDEHAQKEIRQIATLIGEELEWYHPSMQALDWRNGMFMFTK